MSARPAARSLIQDLDLLDRIGRVGGVRERTALSIRIDEWIDYDEPVRLPGGGSWPEPGHLLHRGEGQTWWLLSGGRLLLVPGDPSLPPREATLDDPAIDPAALAGHLRPIRIERLTEGVPLTELAGPTVPGVVAELLDVAWRTEASGREAIFRMLANAMRAEPGWSEAVTRLKAAFERGLGDRSRAVRAVSVRALVNMAAGRLPSPPTGRPTRLLAVMLHMPREDVKVDALAALLELPGDLLEELSETLLPLLQELVSRPEAEVRRLAGELQLRLAGGGETWAISRELAAPSAERRSAALDRLAGEPEAQLEVLLPRVLDALADPAAEVRGAALGVLQPRIAHMAPELRRRVLVTLLRAADPRAVELAVGFLRRAEVHENGDLQAALRDSLDGPPAARQSAAQLWMDLHRPREAEALVAGYRVLLHHPDPVLRQTILRQLSQDPPDRQTVRDALFKLLVERLQDEEPSLRIDAARCIVALAYPHAADIVGQLIFDRDRYVRRATGQLIEDSGDPRSLEDFRKASRAIERLGELDAVRDRDDRQAWALALEEILRHPSSRVTTLLASLLSTIPADTSDPFLRFAVEEIEAGLLRRAESPDDLLAICRRLIEPPSPQPEHAVRMAAGLAGEEAAAFDFLWTCYVSASGAASRAAERALSGLAPVKKSPEVMQEIQLLWARTEQPEARRLLARLAGR